jgi:hypothetical protein
MSSRSEWTPANRIVLAVFSIVVALGAVSLRRALEVEGLPPLRESVSPEAGPRRIPRPLSLSEEQIVAVVNRDPFHPQRRRPDGRFPVPGRPGTIGLTPAFSAAPAPPPPVVPRLLGTTVLLGGKGFAMLEAQGQPPRLLRVGESLDAFKLREVGRGRAVLLLGDSTIVLELRNPAN